MTENIFLNLARKVEQEWLTSHNDLTGFTELATQHLKNFKYEWALEKLDREIKSWLLETPKLPEQLNIHNVFGQPSVTVFNNGKFILDLYFWVDFDTSIHSHGFRGAFLILHGQSLHETFKTLLVKKLSEDLRIIDMSNVDLEKLKAGDVHPIAPGSDLTHRVIHLENPTVTLCLRTVNEPELKQWTYLPTGLAVQKQSLSADLVKKIYFYQYLSERDAIQAEEYLSKILSTLSISSVIHLYEEVASGGLGLREDVVDTIATTVVSLYENSEWWPLYEKAHLARMDEIRFEEFQDPLDRLKAHFQNCGYSAEQLAALR